MTQSQLATTPILDYQSTSIQSLVKQRGWLDLGEYDRIGAVYTFVRDEIKFGYNQSDDISASSVLTDGYGQCNTKGTLLMALLRAVGISCRIHGFTIERTLQKGAIPAVLLYLAPRHILHSWVEVLYEKQWLNLEGFILDKAYLQAIQNKFKQPAGGFSGYGIATTCMDAPEIDWTGKDTYIQKEGISKDFGVFDSPDDFYNKQGTNLKGIKRWLYQHFIRHIINLNVKRLRTF